MKNQGIVFFFSSQEIHLNLGYKYIENRFIDKNIYMNCNYIKNHIMLSTSENINQESTPTSLSLRRFTHKKRCYLVLSVIFMVIFKQNI